MARIAIKSNANRQIILCRDDRGFFLQTIHSDEKKPIEERAVTIGEAKQFYDRAERKAEKFNADGYEYREYVKSVGGPEVELQESIRRRMKYVLRDENEVYHINEIYAPHLCR